MTAHLSSRGVRVDGDLAGSSTVAVNRCAHLLPGNDGADLLLRRHVLPGPGLPQGVQGKGGVALHLRARVKIFCPARRKGRGGGRRGRCRGRRMRKKKGSVGRCDLEGQGGAASVALMRAESGTS